ncbi:hypothetical protein WR25_20993 [Diploscapter pachys]|uniref:Uncharacterized protein n=1 Tax=Diploscapter pachys TaxID=2018661 RepID=A0A2A2K4B0_9BILA|nr:hypothetical protein WR25_20993 [Diploscapter pachys]
MPHYRVYVLNDHDKISKATDIQARDDTHAFEAAEKIQDAQPLEIWQGTRLVGRYDRYLVRLGSAQDPDELLAISRDVQKVCYRLAVLIGVDRHGLTPAQYDDVNAVVLVRLPIKRYSSRGPSHDSNRPPRAALHPYVFDRLRKARNDATQPLKSASQGQHRLSGPLPHRSGRTALPRVPDHDAQPHQGSDRRCQPGLRRRFAGRHAQAAGRGQLRLDQLLQRDGPVRQRRPLGHDRPVDPQLRSALHTLASGQLLHRRSLLDVRRLHPGSGDLWPASPDRGGGRLTSLKFVENSNIGVANDLHAPLAPDWRDFRRGKGRRSIRGLCDGVPRAVRLHRNVSPVPETASNIEGGVKLALAGTGPSGTIAVFRQTLTDCSRDTACVAFMPMWRIAMSAHSACANGWVCGVKDCSSTSCPSSTMPKGIPSSKIRSNMPC